MTFSRPSFKLPSLFTFITFLQISLSLSCQVPNAVNYQAIVRDNAGALIQNHGVKFKLSILQGSITGSAVYEETQLITTNQFGLASLVLGRGNTISGNFSNINWSLGSYFLQIAMDVSGGSNFTTFGTQELVSVPYALYAKNTDEHQALSINGNQLSISNGNSVILPNSSSNSTTGVFQQTILKGDDFTFVNCTSEPGVDSFLAVFSYILSNNNIEGKAFICKKDGLTGAYLLFPRGGSVGWCGGGNGVTISSAVTHHGTIYFNFTNGCYSHTLSTITGLVTYDVQPSGSNGIIFSDGTYLYVNNNSSNNYLKYNASGNTLNLVGTLTFNPILNSNVTSVMSDGNYIYALSSFTGILYKYSNTGTLISQKDVGLGPLGLVNLDADKIFIASPISQISSGTTKQGGFILTPVSKP